MIVYDSAAGISGRESLTFHAAKLPTFDIVGCDAALAAEIAKEIALLPYNPNSPVTITIGLIEIIITLLGVIIIFV